MPSLTLIGLGPAEIVVIVVAAFIVLVIFGPKNLPKLGNSLGKGIKGLRKGLSGDDDKKKDDEEEIIVEEDDVETSKNVKDNKEEKEAKETKEEKKEAKKPTTKKKVVKKQS